jgi:hypothetical protein
MAGQPGSNKKRLIFITALGLVALIVIIAANIVVQNSRLDKEAQIALLNDELSQVRQQVLQGQEPPADLEYRLETAKSELAAAQQTFPSAVDRNDVVDFILNTAEECQVEFIPLVSEGWATENFGQSYNVLKYHGTVTGSLENAKKFMTRLHEGQYPTMTITDCTVQRIGGIDVNQPADSIQVTIELKIALYTFTPAEIGDTAL